MLNNKTILGCLWAGAAVGTLAVALVVSGCATTGNTTDGKPAAAAVPAKGGAQLWAENCTRCHNLRQPTSLSHAEWELAVHHMRIRAPLTGEEQQAIVEFLKSAD